jgi:CheY-like chemotaxis protein
VIEPEKARAALIKDILTALDCSDIFIAKDTEAGFGYLHGRTPRIVLCAGRMAPIDGFEFTRRLRRSANVRNCDVSVVITISGPERGDVLAALNAGADSMLPFPMSAKQLQQMLTALDTQKRPFVRAATYVGPCRRRGLVQPEGDQYRRLEDFGAPEALAALMDALRKTFQAAQRGGVQEGGVEHTAQALAIYLTRTRPGVPIDAAALLTQCTALVTQFVAHAPGQETFDHAFTPLRRLITNVISKSLKGAEAAQAA